MLAYFDDRYCLMKVTLCLLGVLTIFQVCAKDISHANQQVSAKFNGEHIASWVVQSDTPQILELENGLKLGVLIKDDSSEKNAKIRETFPESGQDIVSIELLDMQTTPPTKLSFTWGGTNSRQGFSSLGGANRVEVLGTPGLLLELSRN